MQILVVEDEKKLAGLLKRSLEEAGYAADTAFDGEEALFKLDIQPYDLVILDIMLPKLNGLEVCKRMRRAGKKMPVIMLTALDSYSHKVAGLDVGADDYLAKPFNIYELLARVRALLRRGAKLDPVVLSIDTLSLDPSTKLAMRGKTPVKLTTKEFALLEYFLRHQDRIIPQTELLEHVWDYAYEGLSNVVETYIRYVRGKIAPRGERPLIFTKRGSGYIMTVRKEYVP